MKEEEAEKEQESRACEMFIYQRPESQNSHKSTYESTCHHQLSMYQWTIVATIKARTSQILSPEQNRCTTHRKAERNQRRPDETNCAYILIDAVPINRAVDCRCESLAEARTQRAPPRDFEPFRLWLWFGLGRAVHLQLALHIWQRWLGSCCFRAGCN